MRIFCLLFFVGFQSFAQNPKIKCYFNHPVNTTASTGANAVYLNTTFVDTAVAYINRAKYSIDIAMYNYTVYGGDGLNAIANAINAAYLRGVGIRWIKNGSSTNSGLSLINNGINKLASPTTSAYGICHNKFMVIDVNSSDSNDAIVWTGSFNFSRQQSDNDYNNILIVQDKNVALAYYNEFNKMWGGTGSIPNTATSTFGPNKTASSQTLFYVNGTKVEVYFSPQDGLGQHLQNTINTANSDLFFGIYTFTDATVANLIKTKNSQGITVRGIEDQFSKTYSPFTILSAQLDTNFKVYSDATYIYHNKMLVVDANDISSDPQVFTGSFNWTAAAETKNDENVMVIHDQAIANQYYQSLCANFSDLGGAACRPETVSHTGVNNSSFSKNSFSVFPNPFEEELTLTVGNFLGTSQVKIIDQLGKTIYEVQLDKLKTTLDLKNLTSGFYFISVTSEEKTMYQKLIKN